MSKWVDIDNMNLVTTDTEQTINVLKTFSNPKADGDIPVLLINNPKAFLINGKILDGSDGKGVSILTIAYLGKSCVAVGQVMDVACLINYHSSARIGVDNDGNPVYMESYLGNKNILLHSGNISQFINSSAIKAQAASLELNQADTQQIGGVISD